MSVQNRVNRQFAPSVAWTHAKRCVLYVRQVTLPDYTAYVASFLYSFIQYNTNTIELQAFEKERDVTVTFHDSMSFLKWCHQFKYAHDDVLQYYTTCLHVKKGA